MRRLGACTVLFLLVLGAMAPARAAGERVVKKQYVGAPASAGLVFCGAPRPVVDGAGRTCFLLQPGETVVSVSLDDLSPQPVAGRIVFFGEETGVGEPLDVRGIVPFCGHVSDVVVPDGATHLDVEIGDRVDAPTMACGGVTSGTIGIVTAQFR